MPTNAKATTSTSTAAKRNASTQTTPQARPDAVTYVRQTAERGVDLPVGAALTVRDRVGDVVEPWTKPESRTKELKSLRTQVTRELNKFERRGGQARRKTTQRVRQTRNRVERELKARRREIERTAKQNRVRAEKTVKENRARAEAQLKKAQKTVQERVPALSPTP